MLWVLLRPPCSTSYPGHFSSYDLWVASGSASLAGVAALGIDRQGTNIYAHGLLTFSGPQTSLRI